MRGQGLYTLRGSLGQVADKVPQKIPCSTYPLQPALFSEVLVWTEASLCISIFTRLRPQLCIMTPFFMKLVKHLIKGKLILNPLLAPAPNASVWIQSSYITKRYFGNKPVKMVLENQDLLAHATQRPESTPKQNRPNKPNPKTFQTNLLGKIFSENWKIVFVWHFGLWSVKESNPGLPTCTARILALWPSIWPSLRFMLP